MFYEEYEWRNRRNQTLTMFDNWLQTPVPLTIKQKRVNVPGTAITNKSVQVVRISSRLPCDILKVTQEVEEDGLLSR